MILSYTYLAQKYNIVVNGAIIVGAHYGEEYEELKSNGVKDFVFIEPCIDSFNKLKEKMQDKENVFLFNYACGEKEEKRVMYTGSENEGQSNSLLKMNKHTQIHPNITLPTTEIVHVKRLDDIISGGYELLYMDCQGYEGFVLKGATETLKNINYVYTEVNKDDIYENCTKVEELDLLLSEFKRVETGVWVGNMWSDAFYIRKPLLK